MSVTGRHRAGHRPAGRARPPRAAPRARRPPGAGGRGDARLAARGDGGARAARRAASRSSCATARSGALRGRAARAPRRRRATSSRSSTTAATRCAPATPTRSCRRWASSTCTWSARAATRSCGSASAPTCARSTAPRARRFAVWAPSARSVSVVGDWNGWDGRVHPMRSLGSSGVWELFVPGVGPGAPLQVRDPRRRRVAAPEGRPAWRAPPRRRRARPRWCSAVARTPGATGTGWQARAERRPHAEPVSIYEVHLPSWRLEPRRGQPPAHLSRAGRRAGRLRRPTWASPTWSCCR